MARLLDFAAFYDLVQRLVGARRFRERLVAQIIRPLPGTRLVDLGCGTGALLDALPREIDYVGCDPNRSYIAAARRRYGQRGTFLHRAAPEAGTMSEPVDIVVAVGVLHHLPDDAARQLVRSAYGLLQPGGRFVSVDAARAPGTPALARWLVAADRGRHVRTPAQYASLVAQEFSKVQTTAHTDLLRVPYLHAVVCAERS